VYFAIQPLLDFKPKQLASSLAFKEVTILWDASRSRAEFHQFDYIVLQELWGRFQKDKTSVIKIIPFRNSLSLSEAKTFHYQNSVTQAEVFLRGLAYEGATDFMELANFKSDSAYLVLFSDCVQTFGVTPFFSITIPLYVFTQARPNLVCDGDFAKSLGSRSSGAHFSISSETNRSQITSFVSSIGSPQRRFISAQFKVTIEGLPVPSSYGTMSPEDGECAPSEPTTLQDFVFMGKFTKNVKAFDVILNFGTGGQPAESLAYSCNVQNLAKNNSTDFRILQQNFGLKKIAQLALVPGKKGLEKIKKIGIALQIVTSQTSFLVLETLDQFLKYKIRPPAVLWEIQRQYDIIAAQRGHTKLEKKEKKIFLAVDIWRRRVSWLCSDATNPENSSHNSCTLLALSFRL